MTRLMGFGIYIGIGALLHAIFVGSHFDFTSAWTFGWLLGWPIMLIISFGAFMLAVGALCLLVIGMMALFGKL
jgi:hypothetical protein